MKKSSLTVVKGFETSQVDSRLFSSFIEHLGRAVYGGIYDPESVFADSDGFRTDVIELVKDLSVHMVRYPGGNFVSGYFWEDGIGDKSKRPRRPDLAWRTIEPNLIGLDEFQKWAKKANTATMMAVNLGTRGTQDALNLLEYCNIPGGTHYSELRKQNGSRSPYSIKTWCLGNEMDGPWQTCHKTPYEYGRLAAETGRAMKRLDHDIELVACGSSNSEMPTFPDWERIVLTEAYDTVDYISMHQYFGKTEDGTAPFLANSLELDRFINTVVSTLDYVKAAKRGKKDIMISFDEWNVWYHNREIDSKIMEESAWTVAPPLLEDIYTHEDALLVASMLITLLRHADRIKIACLAQLVNVIAPIMVTNGKAWRQTIYYPFMQVASYAQNSVVMTPITTSDTYSTPSYSAVPYVDSIAVLDRSQDLITLFAVNKCLTDSVELTLDLSSFEKVDDVVLQTEMKAELAKTNGPNGEIVHPLSVATARIENKKVIIPLAKASWNTIRIKVK